MLQILQPSAHKPSRDTPSKNPHGSQIIEQPRRDVTHPLSYGTQAPPQLCLLFPNRLIPDSRAASPLIILRRSRGFGLIARAAWKTRGRPPEIRKTADAREFSTWPRSPQPPLGFICVSDRGHPHFPPRYCRAFLRVPTKQHVPRAIKE